MYRILGKVDGKMYVGGTYSTYEKAELQIAFLNQYYIENTHVMFDFHTFENNEATKAAVVDYYRQELNHWLDEWKKDLTDTPVYLERVSDMIDYCRMMIKQEGATV